MRDGHIMDVFQNWEKIVKIVFVSGTGILRDGVPPENVPFHLLSHLYGPNSQLFSLKTNFSADG